jgi:hypothetical protein
MKHRSATACKGRYLRSRASASIAIFLSAAIAGMIFPERSDAAEPPADKTPTSGDDFHNDLLVLQSNAYDLVRLKDQTANWLALRGTVLRVTQDLQDVKKNRELLVSVVSTPWVVEKNEKDGTFTARNDRVHIGVGGLIDCPTDQSEIRKLVQLDEVYKISKSALDQYGFSRSGWVYGALLVPYKYHFHDKSFASATTIGPYLGYSMGGLGLKTAFVTSVGLSSLAVANPNGSGDTSTIQGFSIAIGLIGDVNKNNNPMTFGVLVGKDWAGSNSSVPYKHEGKAWAAVHIGFNFSK